MIDDTWDDPTADDYPRSYPAQAAPKYAALEDWLNEIDGHGLRAERIPPGAYPWIAEAWKLGAASSLPSTPSEPAQAAPSRKQIEAVIDDYLGNIDATYEDSRARCAQAIFDLYVVSSTTLGSAAK